MARIIITGTSSGCGKTTLTIGLLSALKKRGINPYSLKVGPDYIDPMFHRSALGIESSNVDLFMMGYGGCREVLSECESSSDIAVIEGVMGYYDGLAGISYEGSTYDLSVKTGTPSILVVNARGKSLSILAEIKGYLEYGDKSTIAGVILNNISPSLYPDMKILIENGFSIKCLGYLEKDENITLNSRHLGLITPDGVNNLEGIIDYLGEKVLETLDIDRILRIASKAPYIEAPLKNIDKVDNVNIAVAYDMAFNFYYRENIKTLEEMGANIIYFSPLRDNHIPENTHGIYIGGGYPELYLQLLSDNTSMKNSILTALNSRMPCIAECGGFMYLNKSIKGEDEVEYPMVGYLSGECYKSSSLVRFGYINITGDNSFLKEGEIARGHEFHYYDCTCSGEDLLASKPLRQRTYKLGVVSESLFAGFHHTHFYSNLEIPRRFITKAKKYKDSIGG
ncbi:MAG: cobyrinate a,c-diamide synthase [Clostridium sp.]|uniref:cobyrinate a,c-diamide synthase n=1 Tax=Clostridium sp. TaxID=1506 RepID=UPI002FC84300